MKLKLLSLFVLSTISLSAQSKYEAGYVVKLSGEKVNAMILYQDWAKNPNNVEVKMGEEKFVHSPKDIKGFGLDNGVYYESYNGKIDQSSQFYNRLSEDKNPEWVETSIFLKQLVDGPVRLFTHDNNVAVTYYFKKDQEEIKPLIYKTYKTSTGHSATNEQFKNQLRANVYCGEQDVKKIKYKTSDLENYFVSYNQCVSQTDYVYNSTERTKNKIEFGIQAGIRSEKNFVNYPVYEASHSFSATSPTFGINAEYQFPFLQNRYALAIEANYFHFKRQDVQANPRFGLAVERKFIEIPLGLQYYVMNDTDHKLFLGAFYNIKIDLANSNYTEVVYSESSKTDIDNISSFSLGAGYQWKNLGVKARYNMNSKFDVGQYMKGETSSFSLNLFYKFTKLEF